MIIDQLFTRPLFEQAPMASPEQLAYNKLRAQHDSYQAMTGGGGNTAVSRDPAHAAKLATVPAEIARMAAALKAKGIDAEAEYDALSGPVAAPVDANQAYGGVAEGLTEMDKSQTPPGRDGNQQSPRDDRQSRGRDTGPRSGPDRVAKPVSKQKATRDMGDMFNQAFTDSHKKKDVKEANQEIYSTVPFELARTAPGIQMAKMAGQSAVAAVKNKFDDLRVKNPKAWEKAMQAGSARGHGGAPSLPADAGRLMGNRAEYMKKVKSAPSEWDDTTGSIGMDPQMKSPFPPLMKKLQAAMVKEGRVKELADDLKTLNDAEFMKKYGKAKAAIRKDMKRVDENKIEKTKTGIIHRGDSYGGGEELPNGGGNRSGFPNPGKYAKDLDHLDKNLTSKLDHSMGISWPRGRKKQDLDEGNMPQSVIKSKQKYADMSDQEFHAAHKNKSEDDLKSMAWRHGYGKGSNHYVNRHKKGGSQLNELSTNRLAQYKTAAAADAKQADQAGDVKRGDKRFGGIVKATKKQFDNDAKKIEESRQARQALMAQIVNSR